MPKEAEARPQKKTQIDANHRRRVLEIAKGLSATLGSDFFHSVVRHLAAALQADCAYLAELTGEPPDRIRALAVFRDQEESSHNLEQQLAGTASSQVLSDGSFACRRDVRKLFPLDELIDVLDAEGYVGFRLSNSAGQPLGILAMVSRKGFADIQFVQSVLEAFVPRAAAELERKRADDLHRENEERYHAFVSTNPDAMWRVEFEQPIPLSLPEEEQIERIYRFGNLAECNDALARLAGAENAAELAGSPFAEIALRINPDAREELRSAIRSGFRTATVETTPPNNGGPQCYRLRSQFGVVENGELHRIWGTTRDITELRRAEFSLAASERRFREVLESIGLPAVMLDLDGAITFANPHFLRLAQRSWEELSTSSWLAGVVSEEESKTWKAILPPDERGRHSAVHFEGVILPRDGPPRVISWDTIGLLDQDDQLVGLAAIGRDITHQKALEAGILQAQKLESVGRLAAGIAHDFNNMLTVVMGQTAMLLNQTPDTEPARARLSLIEKAATQCVGLTGQLLAFARKQDLRPSLINLNEVITGDEGIIRSLIGDAIDLVLDLSSPLGLVYVDPTQIQRCLFNLVTNARDAMPEGGRMIITTSILSIGAGDEAHSPVTPGPYVRLSVSDSGLGLTEDIRTHIFEPFFTTKEVGKGTGLGLSTVYGIVTQSSGLVEVHSEPGEGTTFDILLPLARANS